MTAIINSHFGGAERLAGETKKEALQRGQELIARFTGEAADRAIELFGQGAESQRLGFQGALDIFGQTIPEQARLFGGGNVAAQQQLISGLPQIQAALLGQPVDFSQFQPTSLTPQLDFAQAQLPAPAAAPAAAPGAPPIAAQPVGDLQIGPTGQLGPGPTTAGGQDIIGGLNRTGQLDNLASNFVNTNPGLSNGGVDLATLGTAAFEFLGNALGIAADAAQQLDSASGGLFSRAIESLVPSIGGDLSSAISNLPAPTTDALGNPINLGTGQGSGLLAGQSIQDLLFNLQPEVIRDNLGNIIDLGTGQGTAGAVRTGGGGNLIALPGGKFRQQGSRIIFKPPSGGGSPDTIPTEQK